MTREMQKAIKERKAEAALLVRYANPKSRSKPTAEQVLEVLKRHIPYRGTIRPIIKKFTVSEFNRNPIQRSAHFLVELDNGKQWDISAYENLKGRTPEEKEADKTATFPSGLFTIFHDEIKSPEIEPEQKEEDAGTMERYELTPTDTRTGYSKLKAWMDNYYGESSEEITITYNGQTYTGHMYGNDECWDNDEFFQYFLTADALLKMYYNIPDGCEDFGDINYDAPYDVRADDAQYWIDYII